MQGSHTFAAWAGPALPSFSSRLPCSPSRVVAGSENEKLGGGEYEFMSSILPCGRLVSSALSCLEGCFTQHYNKHKGTCANTQAYNIIGNKSLQPATSHQLNPSVPFMGSFQTDAVTCFSSAFPGRRGDSKQFQI